MQDQESMSDVLMIWMGVLTVLMVGGAVYLYRKLKSVGE